MKVKGVQPVVECAELRGGLIKEGFSGGNTGGCIGVSGCLGQKEQWMLSPDVGKSPVGSEIQKPVTAGVPGEGRGWGGGGCGHEQGRAARKHSGRILEVYVVILKIWFLS